MDDQQHRRQGLALAIAGLLLVVVLFTLVVLMGGFAPASPEGLIVPGAFVLIAAGGWALWRARRYGLAWSLLVGLPSLALGLFIGFFILFALGISANVERRELTVATAAEDRALGQAQAAWQSGHMEADLIPFPNAPEGAVRRIRVEMRRDGSALRLRYVLEGEVDKVRWPGTATAGRADELWRTTCFEVFVDTGDGYREFNLSPSNQWASYHFDGYRQGMRNAVETAVVTGLEAGEDQAALEARIELPPGARRLALSTVIEDVDGSISYWALAHPAAEPNFHHPDSFTLDLP